MRQSRFVGPIQLGRIRQRLGRVDIRKGRKMTTHLVSPEQLDTRGKIDRELELDVI